jgi:hypothetical protein
MSSDAIVVALIVACVALVKALKSPIGQAIADRIRGGATPDPDLLAEVDQLRTRLAEVEERLDFAERLLATAEQPERLQGRSHP